MKVGDLVICPKEGNRIGIIVRPYAAIQGVSRRHWWVLWHGDAAQQAINEEMLEVVNEGR